MCPLLGLDLLTQLRVVRLKTYYINIIENLIDKVPNYFIYNSLRNKLIAQTYFFTKLVAISIAIMIYGV